MRIFATLQSLLDQTRSLDFLAPLMLRLYLAPVMWVAGSNKLQNFDNTVQWFESGLELPFPWVMAFLATATELVGALALLFGVGLRWITVPLMFTMAVAAFSVHWKYGWQTIADPVSCLFNCSDAEEASKRLGKAKEILKTHGKYDYLTGQGSFVVLNNGIQSAATYFIMLLVLFFQGAGRYVSVDYWVRRRVMSAA